MATISIEGSIELTPELFKLLFDAMTPLGRETTAGHLAHRLCFGELSEKTAEAAAKEFAMSMRLPEEMEAKFRAQVMNRVLAQADKPIDPKKLDAVMSQAAAEAAGRVADTKAEEWFAKLKPADIKEIRAAIFPKIQEAIRGLAEFFYKKGQGVQMLSRMVQEPTEDEIEAIRNLVHESLIEAAGPVARQHAQNAAMMGLLNPTNGTSLP